MRRTWASFQTGSQVAEQAVARVADVPQTCEGGEGRRLRICAAAGKEQVKALAHSWAVILLRFKCGVGLTQSFNNRRPQSRHAFASGCGCCCLRTMPPCFFDACGTTLPFIRWSTPLVLGLPAYTHWHTLCLRQDALPAQMPCNAALMHSSPPKASHKQRTLRQDEGAVPPCSRLCA